MLEPTGAKHDGADEKGKADLTKGGTCQAVGIAESASNTSTMLDAPVSRTRAIPAVTTATSQAPVPTYSTARIRELSVKS